MNSQNRTIELFFDDYMHYKKAGCKASSTAKESLKRNHPEVADTIIRIVDEHFDMIKTLKKAYKIIFNNVKAPEVGTDDIDEFTMNLHSLIKRIEL